MYECATCNDTFWSRIDCEQHMSDFDHYAECESCTRLFSSQQAANQHMNALDHWAPEYPCETCDRTFNSENGADNHMAAKNHYKDVYCQDCDRYFQNPNNLKAHMNSRTHRGTTITCPFCKDNYVTASGLAQHLETGSCHRAPQLNRDTILCIIREKDPHGVITIRQLTWHDGTSGTYSATDRAWNGDGWECYLCHREFNTANSLNQHLNSSAHQQKVYHCPNGRCGKEFKALTGLFNHLESESCAFMLFEKVQTQVGNVLIGNRMLTFG